MNKEYSETIKGQLKKLRYWLHHPNLDIYEDGWDSYDAKSVKKETILGAIEFLNSLDKDYVKSIFVCPCSNGKAVFEITAIGK